MHKQSYCLDIRTGDEACRESLISFLNKNKEVLGVTSIERDVYQDANILRVYSGEGCELVHHIREEYFGGCDFDFTVHMTAEECHRHYEKS